MRWLTFLGGLAVFAIGIAVVGSLVSLGGLLGGVDVLLVVVLTAAAMLAVGILGTRRPLRLWNPYW